MPDVFELNSEFERIVDRIKIAERFCESYGGNVSQEFNVKPLPWIEFIGKPDSAMPSKEQFLVWIEEAKNHHTLLCKTYMDAQLAHAEMVTKSC